jgi:hypothetical protein
VTTVWPLLLPGSGGGLAEVIRVKRTATGMFLLIIFPRRRMRVLVVRRRLSIILKTEQYWAAIQSLVDPSTFRWSRVSRSHLTPGEHHERPACTKCDGQMMFTGMVAGPLGFNQPPHLPGLPAPQQSWRHGLFTERQPNQICRVSGAEFPHQPRTMTFERPRTDVHPHRTLLVGASLADMPQNFPLPRG